MLTRMHGVLCEKIAHELSKNAYISKNDVYKRVIQEAGTFTYIPIKNDAVERFIEIWHGHGLGWHAEDAGPAKTEVIQSFAPITVAAYTR